MRNENGTISVAAAEMTIITNICTVQYCIVVMYDCIYLTGYLESQPLRFTVSQISANVLQYVLDCACSPVSVSHSVNLVYLLRYNQYHLDLESAVSEMRMRRKCYRREMGL